MIYGAMGGMALGPAAVVLLAASLSSESRLNYGDGLWMLYLGSLGIVPVAAVIGGTIAYITRPNQ